MTHAEVIIALRPVVDSDLPLFFEHQTDSVANQMAAFTARDPNDREAFMAHWAKIRADEGIAMRTILYGDAVAGYISRHGWFGDPELTYWIDKALWGRGVASAALLQFLEAVSERPLYARVAIDNLGSRRVLEKAGFEVVGEDRGFAHARGEEIDELILKLA